MFSEEKPQEVQATPSARCAASAPRGKPIGVPVRPESSCG
jgi:hypothetical protein